jgi:phosphoribosylamine--glycine ligase
MDHQIQKLLNSSALTVVLYGKSSRTDAILRSLCQSKRIKHCYVQTEVCNQSLASKATVEIGQSVTEQEVTDFARRHHPDFAVFGPEEPLAAGAVDWLKKLGVPSVGPTGSLARLESSKAFTRRLLSNYNIEGNPEYRIFETLDGLPKYLHELGEYVIKPDSLTGGKGVKVSGDHLETIADGIEYARSLLAKGVPVVVEEKLEGEEFSLQSFCDGKHLIDMVPVQDHKRALAEDRGPNTGGMGSYSCEDHSLPFLSPDDLSTASRINREVAAALSKETGEEYKGIIYGSFMITASGLKVIEYNARFGDPECLNVLSILETDFADICVGIITGTLDKVPVTFARKATVCKYVVPDGYPDTPVRNSEIMIPAEVKESDDLRIYYGAVDELPGGKALMTGSRAVAFVGIGDTLAGAERIAEAAISKVSGRVFHRKDIGTAALVQKRVDHMNMLRARARLPLRRAL